MPVESTDIIAPEATNPQPVPQPSNPSKFSPSDTFPVADLKHEKFGHPEKFGQDKVIKFDRRPKHEDKKKSHLTEAEKSVMYLHKLERMEREKREKYRREPVLSVDDFASNIEKAIANVLKKDRPFSDEEKDEEKRGKKRKKKDKDRKKKQRKVESPKGEEIDESEMLNVRGGSPDQKVLKENGSTHSEDSGTEESEGSSDHSGEERRERRREKREKRNRKQERNRERRRDGSREKRSSETQLKDAQHLCVYYIQGKCQKGDECPYSHELQPPMKWELCKFYLNDCCAKGDKCLYMHSDFPCKFYHTGQPCLEAENCKFAHGRPLSDRLRQILFKHIETAPKDILGRFPRMGREEAVFKINQTQKTLEVKYGVEKKESTESISKSGIPSLFDINVPVPLELLQDDSTTKEKTDKPVRNRPSRWQDADPLEKVQALQEQRKMQLQVSGFGLKNLPSGNQDQDMRINSNGDIDMRTLALLPVKPHSVSQQNVNSGSVMLPNSVGVAGHHALNLSGKQGATLSSQTPSSKRNDENRHVDIEQYKREAGFNAPSRMDTDIRSLRGDIDIRNHSNVEVIGGQDVDTRHLNLFDKKDLDIRLFSSALNMDNDDENIDEPKLQIVMDDDQEKTDESQSRDGSDVPVNLPKRQRELFMRIQAQQKENLVEQQRKSSDTEENNIDWYSDDSNEGRLTIKDDDDMKDKEEEKPPPLVSPPIIKPMEVMEKLGDLSKIDISEEVTKLLSSMRQTGVPSVTNVIPQSKPKDPRHGGSNASPIDPRKARLSVEEKPREKISIYEQGGFNPETLGKDVDLRSIDKDLDLRPKFGSLDLRSSRPDVDLRQLGLPFKAIQNYTPATEIDASVNSHPLITWATYIVEVPKPDYTGLKLSLQEAQTTGDPRLRKIFRLSTEEKDSPASPKESPKAAPNPRVDPRRRKLEDAKTESSSMSYAQQMTMLQGSSFYQNLTSNQKVTLNQELSTRDQSGGPNEQILAGILGALGLVQGQSGPSNINGSVLNLLSTISNMINPNMLGQNTNIGPQNQNSGMIGPNPALLNQNQGMLNQNSNLLGQQVNPNILGQNPNLMNQMAQSVVQPGLLGAAPGIPNLPPDFPINFDPRNGGLLGNAPPFVNFPPDNANFNFNDEYYPEGGGGSFSGNNRDNRGYNRDRPNRRGRNFNRNNRNTNFRNRNRTNRSHTPP